MNEDANKLLTSIDQSLSRLADSVGHINTSIKKYSLSNDSISKKIFYLNIVLTIATLIGAIAAICVFIGAK